MIVPQMAAALAGTFLLAVLWNHGLAGTLRSVSIRLAVWADSIDARHALVRQRHRTRQAELMAGPRIERREVA